MRPIRLGAALAVGVAAVGVLSALAALSMPVADRKAPPTLILSWLALLLLHAAVYHAGERIRDRAGLAIYVGAHAAILFAVAVLQPPPPLTILLYMVAVAELVMLAGSVWGTVRITIGAVSLLVVASLITSGLYRATTDGVILAATGLIVQTIAALLNRHVAEASRTAPVALGNGASALTAREVDVLRELVSGARSSDIGGKLGISERTVKAHLGSIYQKLGVATRSAAVAVAVQRKLV